VTEGHGETLAGRRRSLERDRNSPFAASGQRSLQRGHDGEAGALVEPK
jgi:hypothetical protein